MDEIEPGLWLGTAAEAQGLTGADWRILCVLENPPAFPGKEAMNIPVFDPAAGKADHVKLEAAARIIDGWLLQKKKVLVCCGASAERSPLTVAYYLSWRDRVPVSVAYDRVEAKHPQTQRRLYWL